MPTTFITTVTVSGELDEEGIKQKKKSIQALFHADASMEVTSVTDIASIRPTPWHGDLIEMSPAANQCIYDPIDDA